MREKPKLKKYRILSRSNWGAVGGRHLACVIMPESVRGEGNERRIGAHVCSVGDVDSCVGCET